jgi:hypothetical protein
MVEGTTSDEFCEPPEGTSPSEPNRDVQVQLAVLWHLFEEEECIDPVDTYFIQIEGKEPSKELAHALAPTLILPFERFENRDLCPPFSEFRDRITGHPAELIRLNNIRWDGPSSARLEYSVGRGSLFGRGSELHVVWVRDHWVICESMSGWVA